MHIVTQQRTSTTEHVAEQLIVLLTFKNSFIIIIFVVLLLSYVQITNYVSRWFVCYNCFIIIASLNCNATLTQTTVKVVAVEHEGKERSTI